MKQGFDWETKVSCDRPSLDPSHRVLSLFSIRQIGGEAIALPADAADLEQVKAMADKAIQQ
jgi:hypothetical protein